MPLRADGEDRPLIPCLVVDLNDVVWHRELLETLDLARKVQIVQDHHHPHHFGTSASAVAISLFQIFASPTS
jgi:hypothetical protein